MWLSDGSYEIVRTESECLDIIEERLGHEMRSFIEEKFMFVDDIDTVEDYWEERIERISKCHRERMKMIDTLYHMTKEEKI